ncbi:putative protein phosphatase 2C 1 [Tetrabaena socialis]|uniref:Protein phosphatase n=1 Tax=Tetrabaena socialis TaxID=47790 RepID=A0A2J7ZKQ0_9CHLO|nr:putative protein phosphatase 2C 1 [Tetrabaena socialis]|eukprot:PNH00830.1 putative protein phosphatase 2C 1 [Tetrabaena socialis]
MRANSLPRRVAVTSCPPRSDSAMFGGIFKFGKRRQQQYVAPASGIVNSFSTGVELASSSAPTLTAAPPTDLSVRPLALAPGKALALRTAVCYLPHPEKVHYGGEDAHFMSEHGGGIIGVADGVGGWQESGVNPADYSRTLMQLSRAYLEGKDIFTEEAAARQGVLVDPKGALEAAHAHTKVPGSATACVMQLDQANGLLAAANLGDSGFVVIRNGRELIRSKPLQHYFDCPLQFGAFPEFVEATDTADMADLYSVSLRPGDILIAGTDGLWDNCYMTEVVSLLPKTPAETQSAADAIAATARRHASDTDFASPYTREALSQGLDLPWWDKVLGMSFKGGKLHLKQLTGGKMDDITVLVSYVIVVNQPEAAASDGQAIPGDGVALEHQPQ